MFARFLLAPAGALALVIAGCASSNSPSAAVESAASDSATTQPAVAVGERIDTDTATLVVYGMSCPQCSDNVRRQLLAVPGVRDVTLDLGTGEVSVRLMPRMVRRSQLAAAVKDSGFTLKEIRVG